MIFLSADDIDRVLDWHRMVDHFAACHRQPPAEVGDLFLGRDGRTLLTRAAWLPDGAFGLKTVSVYPDNPGKGLPAVQGAVIVFDGDTGAPAAVLDGAAVTRWKTVGDSLCAARQLARPDARSLLLVGAGVIARTLLDGYLSIFPELERVRIWNRSPERAEDLVRQVKDGRDIAVVTDLDAALEEADIVSSATMSKEPLVAGAHVGQGTHVDLIGAFKPDMREADDALLRKARLFVDSRETTMHDIGEVRIPLETGVIGPKDIVGDLYEICAGSVGRRSPEEITVFKNGGGAHLDMMVASLALSIAQKEAGAGTPA